MSENTKKHISEYKVDAFKPGHTSLVDGKTLYFANVVESSKLRTYLTTESIFNKIAREKYPRCTDSDFYVSIDESGEFQRLVGVNAFPKESSSVLDTTDTKGAGDNTIILEIDEGGKSVSIKRYPKGTNRDIVTEIVNSISTPKKVKAKDILADKFFVEDVRGKYIYVSTEEL